MNLCDLLRLVNLYTFIFLLGLVFIPALFSSHRAPTLLHIPYSLITFAYGSPSAAPAQNHRSHTRFRGAGDLHVMVKKACVCLYFLLLRLGFYDERWTVWKRSVLELATHHFLDAEAGP
jgi:hypothetical protein